MEDRRTGKRAPGRPRRPRYIFQIDRGQDGAVIRVLDTRSGGSREIPIADFVAYAKSNRDVRPFLLGVATAAD